MGIVSKIERGIGKAAESIFRFKKHFDPIELDWIVRKQVESLKQHIVDTIYAPNEINIYMSESDYSEYSPLSAKIKEQLRVSIISLCKDRNYSTPGEIKINISCLKELKKGNIKIEPKMLECEPLKSENCGRIEVELKDEKKQIFSLEYKEKYLIGRDKECDAVIDKITVSRKHAEIFRRGDETVILDLGSRNGTEINGRNIQEAVLKDGDVINLGDVRIVWYEK